MINVGCGSCGARSALSPSPAAPTTTGAPRSNLQNLTDTTPQSPPQRTSEGGFTPRERGGLGGHFCGGWWGGGPQSPPQLIVGAPWPGRPEEGEEDDSKYQLRAAPERNQ